MSIYYKVTKPSGASFHTDRVVYKVGRRVRPLAHDGTRELCGPGVLHASPSAPEAAGYGSWPYRLFKVEGRPFIEDTDKAGFKQLTVVAEADVVECFGPNGSRVLALVRRCETLSDDEAGRLTAAWDAAGTAARYAAWDAAGAAAGYAAGTAARYAAGAAAGALAVEDLIGQHGYTRTHHDTLMGPWVEVMGEDWT